MDSNGLRFWMLSQLNDWLPPWRAGTAYLAGQGVADPNGNIQIVQAAGKSDAAQPAWNTVIGQTTQDAGITWMNSGPGSWQAGTCFSVGQYGIDLRTVTCNTNRHCYKWSDWHGSAALAGRARRIDGRWERDLDLHGTDSRQASTIAAIATGLQPAASMLGWKAAGRRLYRSRRIWSRPPR